MGLNWGIGDIVSSLESPTITTDRIGAGNIINYRGPVRPMELAVLDKMIELDNGETPIILRIYSPGGDVFTAMTISDRIKQEIKSPVYAILEGYVASAATIIALAADKVYSFENAYFMIHQVARGSLFYYRTAAEQEDDMRLTNNLMDGITRIYTGRSSLDEKTVRDMLRRDTWLSASEAKGVGFVDGIIGSDVSLELFLNKKETKDVILDRGYYNMSVSENLQEEEVQDDVTENSIVAAVKGAIGDVPNEAEEVLQEDVADSTETVTLSVEQFSQLMDHVANLQASVDSLTEALPVVANLIVSSVNATSKQSSFENKAGQAQAQAANKQVVSGTRGWKK